MRDVRIFFVRGATPNKKEDVVNLMTGMRTGKYPFLDPVRDELNRTKWLWLACCFSPIIYFLLARWIYEQWFRESNRGGLLNLASPEFAYAPQLFLAGILLIEPFLLWVKWYYDRKAKTSATLPELMAYYRLQTFICLALSDLAAFAGFIFFILTGEMKSVLIGGVVAFIYYAQSYPSEEGLARRAFALRDKKE